VSPQTNRHLEYSEILNHGQEEEKKPKSRIERVPACNHKERNEAQVRTIRHWVLFQPFDYRLSEREVRSFELRLRSPTVSQQTKSNINQIHSCLRQVPVLYSVRVNVKLW
jgi:hypothetical protein